MRKYSRKDWCRGAFLTFCAAPTLWVAIWILSRAVWGNGALQKEDWERELSARLGVTFEIGEVAYPQFGLAELRQIKLSDSETGQTIARAAAVEVTKTADGYAIELFAPEIEAAQLGRGAQILHERLLCHGSSGIPRCEMSARELTLTDQTGSRTLVQLQAALEPAEAGPQFAGSFRWPDAQDAEHTLEWLLVRNLDLVPPATSFSVKTGQARFPCHLAEYFWPPLQRLGPQAEFSGQVSWLLSERGSAELRGTFFGVDLDSLVSEQFPQILSGKATVRIEHAVIDDGRLNSVIGTVDVSSGRVSRSLLMSAAEHLKLQNLAGAGDSDVLPFRRLAGSFRMDGPKLQINGSADAANPGVLITSRTAPLLAAPQNHSASAASLARVLLPDSRLQVPLASQTSSLVRLLPSPASSTSQNPQTARRSHIPTRLSPGGSSNNVIRER